MEDTVAHQGLRVLGHLDQREIDSVDVLLGRVAGDALTEAKHAEQRARLVLVSKVLARVKAVQNLNVAVCKIGRRHSLAEVRLLK